MQTPPTINFTLPQPEKNLPGVEKIAARAVLKEINSQFQPLYGKDFTEVLCKLPEAKIQPKETSAEKRKKKRAEHVKVKI